MSAARNAAAWSFRIAAGLLLWGACAVRALAGGGPENLLLVVNANSRDSKTIANHYVHLRQIPGRNVVYLDYGGDRERTDIDTFRAQILQPALEAIDERGLGGQIDYLVYSSDFPWQINAKKDFRGVDLPAQLSPYASLTGATYLWRLVRKRNHGLVNLKSNLYVQHPSGGAVMTRSYGFRSWYGWGPPGRINEAGGQRYLLSTMLAVTSGRGNSVAEAISYLKRSARADGSRPGGTVYLMKNGDVRSRTRHDRFESTARELKLMGLNAEVLSGKIPSDKQDVMGAVVGTAGFDWEKSGSRILPGAICEHLTSTGGVLSKGAGQTPLTEFLRHGAAGASGTVAEPYAIGAKFPQPSLHVHYARGCSLAEAFYQSIAGPYQLLIVGDALCQPWARIPRVSVEGVKPGAKVRGVIEIRPSAEADGIHAADVFSLFVDGRRFARKAGGRPLQLDTRSLADGYHELRIVATESSPVECQGRKIVPVIVDNHGGQVELNASAYEAVSAADELKLSATCAGAAGILILHGSEILARIAGAEGTATVQAGELGLGPVRLQAVALGKRQIFSKPVELVVQ